MESLLVARLIVLCIIMYFIIANTIFIWRRLQWQRTFTSKSAVRYMRLIDFSRSSFLILAVLWNVWTLLLEGSVEKRWSFSCKWSFRVPSFFFTAASFLLIIFVHSRLFVVYSCLSCHSKKASFFTVGLGFFIWIVLGVVNQLLMGHDIVDGVCVVVLNFKVKIIFIVFLVIAEVFTFWMFYKPLRDNKLNGKYLELKSVEIVRDTSNIDYCGMRRCYTKSLLSEPSSEETQISRSKLIEQYTAAVRRNFYSWLVTILITVSWFIMYILYEGKAWYWEKGRADFQTTITMLLLYLSMVACEKYWYKMLKC